MTELATRRKGSVYHQGEKWSRKTSSMRSERDGRTSLVEDDEEGLEEDVSQNLDAAGVVGL